MYKQRPYVDGSKVFYGGKVSPFEGNCVDISSPIIDQATNQRIVIGKMAQMNAEQETMVLESAKAAWCEGRGVWPQMTANDRIDSIMKVATSLKASREQITHILTWEIGKSVADAESEFDRTMKFIDMTVEEMRTFERTEGQWRADGGYTSKTRRGPLGIVLNLGPFNYPFNETYAMLMPALLMGNVVIMKVPTVGGLAHVLTMEAYAQHLPPGAINFISGSGRELMGPLMSTGDIDVLAFIGGAKAADAIIKAHPHPHRLKLFLQLESKNLAIVLPDADIDRAVKQITVGATSFNGQRCTALKLIFVHESLVDCFLPKFVDSVSSLRWGTPWEKGVQITPLAEPDKPRALRELIADAVSRGAEVVNAEQTGGEIFDSIMRPAIVFPVREDMRLWHEEQFGPVIPVATYGHIKEVEAYIARTPYAQQASVFGSDPVACGSVLDTLANVVARVNFNSQCSRSPDTLPFTGRRSSGLGTMSVQGALREFSVEVVVSAKQGEQDDALLHALEAHSSFLRPLQGFDGEEGDRGKWDGKEGK